MQIKAKALCVLIAGVAFMSGCRSSVVYQSKDVQIAVWRVLGANDSVGDICNSGCRLNDAQLLPIVLDLVRNGSVLGPNLQFGNTNGIVINNIFSGLLPPRFGPRDVTPLTMSGIITDYYSTNFPDGFDEDRINIYFCGHVDIPPVNVTVPAFAWTADPRQGANGGVLPMIMMNDGGVLETCFFPNQFLPPFLELRHTLVHEMGHYLGRFDQPASAPATYWPVGSTSTTPNARRYSNTEHRVAGSEKNIMRVVAPGTPYDLGLPGAAGSLGSEKGTVYNRVLTDQYLVP